MSLIKKLVTSVGSGSVSFKQQLSTIGMSSSRGNNISDHVGYIGTAFASLHVDPSRAKEEIIGFARMLGETRDESSTQQHHLSGKKAVEGLSGGGLSIL